MDKKWFFGPFFEKKVRFYVKKLLLQEMLPRGFEITNVISEEWVKKKQKDLFSSAISYVAKDDVHKNKA